MISTYSFHRQSTRHHYDHSSERPSHDVHIQLKTSHCQYSTRRPARLVLCRCRSSGPDTERISCMCTTSWHCHVDSRHYTVVTLRQQATCIGHCHLTPSVSRGATQTAPQQASPERNIVEQTNSCRPCPPQALTTRCFRRMSIGCQVITRTKRNLRELTLLRRSFSAIVKSVYMYSICSLVISVVHRIPRGF